MRAAIFATVVLLGLAGSCPLWAQEESAAAGPDLLSSRFMLDVGGFFPSLTTKARLDSPTLGRGTEISFEDDLDFSDRETLAFGQFTARLSTRWRVQVDYIDLSRSTSATLERQINWGDNVYEIGANLRAYLDTTIIRLAFGYSFWRHPNWELGGTFGFHVMDVAAGLGLSVQSGGGVIDWGNEVDLGGLAPLPNFGFYWAWALSEHWAVSARGDFFAIEINEFGGDLLAGAVNLQYALSDNFSLGAGYSAFKLSADVTKTHWKGSFEFGYNGPRVFACLQF
jgi:hypothetical protein